MTERLASGGWERWPVRKTLDGAIYLCRWCAKPLKGGSNTSYCSPECQHEIEVRCIWKVLAYNIYLRDGCKCQKCGLNIDDLEKFFSWYRKTFRKYSSVIPGSDSAYGSVAQQQHWPFPDVLRRDLGFPENHSYEINHIVALVEGGAPLDPDNLETLCVPCHKKHTAALRRRLAKLKLVKTCDKKLNNPPLSVAGEQPRQEEHNDEQPSEQHEQS